MFLKILNEESQEVYINLTQVEYIYKASFCNNQPVIYFSKIDEGMWYWVFQDHQTRDEAFDTLFSPKLDVKYLLDQQKSEHILDSKSYMSPSPSPSYPIDWAMQNK